MYHFSQKYIWKHSAIYCLLKRFMFDAKQMMMLKQSNNSKIEINRRDMISLYLHMPSIFNDPDKHSCHQCVLNICSIMNF